MAKNVQLKNLTNDELVLHPETSVEQVIGLQDKLDSLASNDNLTALEGRVTTLEDETIPDLEDKIVGVQGELKDYADQIKADILGEQGLRDSFDTLKEIQDWADEHGTDYADLVAGVQGHQTALEGHQTAIEGLQSDIEDELSGMQNAIEEEFSGVQTRLEGVQSQLTGVQNAIEETISGVQTDLDGVQSAAAGVQSQLEGVQDALEGKISGVQDDIDTALAGVQTNAETAISGVQTQFTGVQTVLETAIASLLEQLNGLQNKVKELDEAPKSNVKAVDVV